MIRIKKDGMEITVESLEEYNIVMGITPAAIPPAAPIADVIETNNNGHTGPKVAINPTKKYVFLGPKEKDLYELYMQFPEGLHTSEAAALLNITNSIASSRSYILKTKGILKRRDEHWGYVISPDIHLLEIVVKK